jgi:D-glycero-beta-D-manno-heptose-7-phosphate kinase
MKEYQVMLTRKRVTAILEAIPALNVLVVGDVMLDEYLWGKVHRISPEAPVPVVRVVDRTFNFGGASNVAHNILSLKAKVTIAGVVGQDHQGEHLQKSLKMAGIDTRGLIIDPHRGTTLKTRVIAFNQQVVRIDQESDTPIDNEVKAKLLEFLDREIPRSDAVIVSDYSKGVIHQPVIDHITTLVNRHSVICAIDPKVKNFPHYKNVTVVTPNHHEAGAACGFEIKGIESLQKAGFLLLEKTGCKMVLITWGKDGMGLFEADNTFHHIETVSKNVFDVTGAGDTVISVFTVALAAGAKPFEAAVLSNKAAGIVVSSVGTASVTPKELLETVRKG